MTGSLRIRTYADGPAPESRALLEAALSCLFETRLGTELESQRIRWTADGGGIQFVGEASLKAGGTASLEGKAELADGTLRGFDGTLTDVSGPRRFSLRVYPMAVPRILSDASAALGPVPAPGPQEPGPDAEWGGGLSDDSLDMPQEMFGFPYAFASPGQLDCCVREAMACMERTIVDRMDCQKEYVDRICLPEGLCPGIRAVYLVELSDTLYVATDTVTADPAPRAPRFGQLGVDTAAKITAYVMREYPKVPMFDE